MVHKQVEAHGGNIYLAAEQLGMNKMEIRDFSANINPLGVPDSLKEYIGTNLDSLQHYPDPECSELRQALAENLEVGPEHIIAGNGAAEIIFLLYEVLRPRRVMIPAPAFIEYALAAERSGCEVVYYKLDEEREFRLNARHFIKSLQVELDQGGIDMVFLCNPNNPTAKTVLQEDLAEILAFTASKGICLVIDETFIELVNTSHTRSIVKETARYPNLFVIRAFTKLFALPGLRLGYGIGRPALIEAFWKKKIPWSVNALAAGAGRVLLQDRNYLERTAIWIASEPECFYDELSRNRWINFFKPETNFILGKILDTGFSAKDLRDAMAAKGILIRDCSNFQYLDERFFRIAVKDRAQNEEFLKVFLETLEELAGKLSR